MDTRLGKTDSDQNYFNNANNNLLSADDSDHLWKSKDHFKKSTSRNLHTIILF